MNSRLFLLKFRVNATVARSTFMFRYIKLKLFQKRESDYIKNILSTAFTVMFFIEDDCFFLFLYSLCLYHVYFYCLRSFAWAILCRTTVLFFLKYFCQKVLWWLHYFLLTFNGVLVSICKFHIFIISHLKRFVHKEISCKQPWIYFLNI